MRPALRLPLPFLLLPFLLLTVCCRAQDGTARDGTARDGTAPVAAAGDSLATGGASDSVFRMHKSPLGAVLRSVAFPGWGQLYNESYWKIPLVLGLSAFLTWGIATEHAKYADYRDLYAASITAENSAGDLRLKQYREFYRDNRDSYAWWLLVTYLVQIADAFVDAHLYDFNVSDVAQGSVILSPHGALALRLRW